MWPGIRTHGIHVNIRRALTQYKYNEQSNDKTFTDAHDCIGVLNHTPTCNFDIITPVFTVTPGLGSNLILPLLLLLPGPITLDALT